MKRLILMVFLFFGKTLVAQVDNIKKMETDMNGLSGVAKINKAIEIADYCRSINKNEDAETFAEKAIALAKQEGNRELQAIALNRKGKAVASQDKKGFFGRDKAITWFKSSLQLLNEKNIKNMDLMVDNLESLKSIYQKNNKPDEVRAIDERIRQVKTGNFTDNTPNKKELQSEVIALQQKNQQLLEQNNNASNEQLKLIAESKTLSKNLANKEAAIAQMSSEQLKSELLLMAQQKVVDSLAIFNKVSQMELSNKEIALKEERTKRNLSLIIGSLVLLSALGLLFAFFRQRFFNRLLEEKNKSIKEEKERSENLLLNILPALVATELKAKGQTEARHYTNVTVLFSDFVNFSQIAEQLSPQELVSELDFCFKAFDTIIYEFGLEKIKTIGDSYMCACGVPTPNSNSARQTIAAAIAMQQFLSRWNEERNAQNKPLFQARFGIHSGDVVAGVVGSKKFAFDIWGDTVNIAARMETGSLANRINISGDTYLQVKNDFLCEYRGKIEAKNKGMIDMYFVDNE